MLVFNSRKLPSKGSNKVVLYTENERVKGLRIEWRSFEIVIVGNRK